MSAALNAGMQAVFVAWLVWAATSRAGGHFFEQV